MTAPLDSFETALLVRLREHVDSTETTAARRTSRRWSLGIAAAVTGAAAVTVLPGPGGTVAYSVQEGNAGEIVVEVNAPEDAEGLEDELAEHGIRADVTYLEDRQQCAPGRYRAVDRSLTGMAVSIGADRLTVTLPPGAVRDGETFVMAISGEVTSMGGYSSWTEFDVASGAVEPCDVVPAGTTSGAPQE